MEWYKNDVNDHSIKVPGGLQHIKTLDGYVHPNNIHHGLPYVKMRPCTDAEWDTLPHVICTSDTDWDPTILDHTLNDDDDWYDAIEDLEEDPSTNLFDEYGNYHKCEVSTMELFYFDAYQPPSDPNMDDLDYCVYHAHLQDVHADSKDMH
jgi:hypothetical protein